MHAACDPDALRMQGLNHTSDSAYTPWDNYTEEIRHPLWWPEGYQRHIRGHACYDPTKACADEQIITPGI